MTFEECDTLCRALHALQQKNMGEVRPMNAKAKGSRRERQARTILKKRMKNQRREPVN